MLTLLIISDDFTGALDTGVQFAARGAITSVITHPDFDFSSIDKELQVLVIDAETRHLKPGIRVFRGSSNSRKSVKERGLLYLQKKQIRPCEEMWGQN